MGLSFITSFILYGYLIPISLYVCVEMVKIVQAMVYIGKTGRCTMRRALRRSREPRI